MTSATLLKRVVIVNIADKNGKNTKNFTNRNSIGARIDFTVVKYPQSGGNGLNIANISIYNITDDTFKFLSEQGQEISLEAGWESNYATIFNGSIMSVIRTREGTDIITRIYANENGMTDRVNRVLNKSYNTISLNDFLDSLSSYGFAVNRPNFTEVIQNRTFSGSLSDILRNLAARYNFVYEVKGNILVISKNDDPNRIVFEFSPQSGMIKPPVITEKGADLEIFLQPNINPNDRFKLNSKFATFNIGAMEFVERVREGFINTTGVKFVSGVNATRYEGKYKVIQLQHEGSTHSNTWFTRLDGIRTGQ